MGTKNSVGNPLIEIMYRPDCRFYPSWHQTGQRTNYIAAGRWNRALKGLELSNSKVFYHRARKKEMSQKHQVKPLWKKSLFGDYRPDI